MTTNLKGFGLILFALAFAALGTLQIVNGEILAGRPMAWPDGWPGLRVVSIVSGLLLIAAAASATFKKFPLLALAAGIWILVWCAARNLIFIISHLDYGFMLTNTGKALTLGGGGLLVAKIISDDQGNSTSRLLNHAVTIERIFIGFFFFASGLQHFLFAEFVKSLVPTWIPGGLFWTYLAGAALATAGLGLLTGFKAKLAAILGGWMVFAWLLLLHFPRAMGPGGNLNEWTAVCEATVVSGLLFVLAGRLK